MSFTKKLYYIFRLHVSLIISAIILPCLGSQAASFTVTNNANSGSGSFTWAINQANNTAGLDTISFAISGGAIIQLLAADTLKESTFIDGHSQTLAFGDSVTLDGSAAGSLLVIHNSPNASTIQGLIFRNANTVLTNSMFSSGSVIRNNRFRSNAAVFNGSFNNVQILGNRFELNARSNAGYITASIIKNNTFTGHSTEGLYLGGANATTVRQNSFINCTLGLNLSGLNGCTIDSNYLNGNTNAAMDISFIGTSQINYNRCLNTVNGPGIKGGFFQGNTFTGNTCAGNNGHGITAVSFNNSWINNRCFDNRKSGMFLDIMQFANNIQDNYLFDNDSCGLYCRGNNTTAMGPRTIKGNKIGLDTLGNPSGNRLHGIYILTAQDVSIGSTSLTSDQNVINNNTQDGIQLNGSQHIRMQGNIWQNNGGQHINLNNNSNQRGVPPSSVPGAPIVSNTQISPGNYEIMISSPDYNQYVDLYRSDAGNTEAMEYMGTATYIPAKLQWKFTGNIPTPANLKFMAMATDSNGNSSEILPEGGFVVTNTNSIGWGSLSQVASHCNTAPDTNKVTFNITGSLPYLINTSLGLVNPCIIDGYTQTGIIISGSLDLNGDHQIVRGLQFNSGVNMSGGTKKALLEELIIENPGGTGISLSGGADSNTIRKCVIRNCQSGISGNNVQLCIIDSCTIYNNTNYGIGFSTSAEINVRHSYLYQNGGNGIYITRVPNCIFDGNIIGLDSTLSIVKPNQGFGIGADPWGEVTIINNIVCGNVSGGIGMNRATNCRVQGNYVGTNKLGANLGNGQVGVSISPSCGNIKFGGTNPDSANVIGFNSGTGLGCYSSNNTIFGNYIGVDKNNNDIGNSGYGLELYPDNLVQSNFISYNAKNGISLIGGNNTIQNNYIGTNAQGALQGNGWAGIALTTKNNIVSGNTIAFNDTGIVVKDSMNKISMNRFDRNNFKAIHLLNPPVVKDTASVTAYSILANDTLQLSGTGPVGDKVEIFLGNSNPQNALQFIDSALVDGSGNWTVKVPRGSRFSPLQNNHYVTTSRASENTTSELSMPKLVPVYLCNSTLQSLLPAKTGICYNDSALLSSEVENVNYQWYKDGSLVSTSRTYYAKNSGEYVVRISDGNSCTIDDTTQAIQHNQSLNADFLMSSVAPIGEPVVVIDLSFNRPDSLSWDFDGATFTKQDHYYLLTYPDTGRYTVKLTSYLGTCVRSIEADLVITEDIQVNDPFQYYGPIRSARAYPNPNDGNFSLEVYLKEAQALTLKLFNQNLSEELQQVTLSGSEHYVHDLDISALPSGTYVLRLYAGSVTRGILVVKH